MKSVVDNCLRLDANQLAGKGIFRSDGTTGAVRWSNGSEACLAYTNGNLTLGYSLAGESLRQDIPISTAPCHFGGERFYLHCTTCNRRCYKLVLSHSGFHCRQCYRLPYYTQQCGSYDGLINRLHKIEHKLETKPMRTKTAAKLMQQHGEARARVDAAFVRMAGWVL